MTDALLRGTLQIMAAYAAVFAAILLLTSAAHKLIRWAASREVARQFGRVPESLATPALAAIVSAEIAAAACLIVPQLRMAGALLAAGLWMLYFGLLASALLRDRRDLDCGCSFGPGDGELGAFQLVRSALLSGIAVFVAVTSGGANPTLQASQYLAGFAFLALYSAVEQVMNLQPLRRGATT